MQERIDRDMVAVGNFSAEDIINHSVHPDEFSNLDPGLYDQQKKKGFTNLKQMKKAAQAS